MMSQAQAAAAPDTPAAGSVGPFFATRRQAALGAVLLAGIVYLARVLLISAYGSSVPFWDQWGAEGGAMYVPLLHDSYDWKHLWSLHNEHRVLWQRLLAIALFWLNDGQWDVRVQCLANSAIYSAMLGLLGWYLLRRLRPAQAWPLLLLAALVGALPYGWENTLSGFQSQFHFLYLFTLLLFWAAAYRPATPATALLLALLAACAQFSIATGVLAPAIALGIVGMRWIGGRDSLGRAALLALPLLLVLAVAVAYFPQLPENSLKAQGTRELVDALYLTTSWPSFFPATLLFLLPFVLFAWRFLRERRYDARDGFFAALLVWGLLTAIAIAHSRGHNLIAVTPRYTETLALAGLGTAYFALVLAGGAGFSRWLRLGVAAAVPLVFAAGLVEQSRREWPFVQERGFTLQIGAGNVRAFLEGDPKVLDDKPGFYILFPFAEPLKSTLNDATIRTLLPLSLRLPGAPVANGHSMRCRWNAVETGTLPPQGRLDCGASAERRGIVAGGLTRIAYALWKTLHIGSSLAFRPSPPRAPDATERCSLDMVNLGRVGAGTVLGLPYMPAVRLIGWSVRPGEAPDGPVTVSLVSEADGSTYTMQAVNRSQRPELEGFFNDKRQIDAGFDTFAGAAAVPAGRYRVQLGRTAASACDTKVILVVARDSDERMLY